MRDNINKWDITKGIIKVVGVIGVGGVSSYFAFGLFRNLFCEGALDSYIKYAKEKGCDLTQAQASNVCLGDSVTFGSEACQRAMGEPDINTRILVCTTIATVFIGIVTMCLSAYLYNKASQAAKSCSPFWSSQRPSTGSLGDNTNYHTFSDAHSPAP